MSLEKELEELFKEALEVDQERVLELVKKLDVACDGYKNTEILNAVANLMRVIVVNQASRPLLYRQVKRYVASVCLAMADHIEALPDDPALLPQDPEAVAPTVKGQPS